MKNVLVIIHLPRSSPRVAGLVRYLPEFGWQPVILTGTSSVNKDLPARIIETPYRDALGFLGRWLKINPEKDPGQQIKSRFGVTARKSPLDFFLTLGGVVINYPCPNKNWKPFAVAAGRKLLQAESIDAMISSSAPVTGHLIAAELKKEFRLPWLADLRDLWSQNHNYTYGPVRRCLDRRLEVKTLSGADAITTVSGPWAEKLKELHAGKDVYAIPHGYNPDEVNDPPVGLTEKFTITYTGTIYPRRQDPRRLFAALREAIDAGTVEPDDVEVRFYGPVENWLDREIGAYGLSAVVKQYGPVTQAEAQARQRESQLLLMLDWEDTREKGLHSGKIFEYLAARRPVLATGGSKENVIEALMNETGAGAHATDAAGVRDALQGFYHEYRAHGRVAFRGVAEAVGRYTHREMAGRFAKILDGFTGV